jgi:hypothetical protein
MRDAAAGHFSGVKGYSVGMPYLIFVVLALLVPAKGWSQASKEKEKDAPVPKAYLPPVGMCRIWVDNVPAGRQPAPTDCATAIRNRPPNARVIFPAGKGRSAPKLLAPGQEKRDSAKKKKPPRS